MTPTSARLETNTSVLTTRRRHNGELFVWAIYMCAYSYATRLAQQAAAQHSMQTHVTKVLLSRQARHYNCCTSEHRWPLMQHEKHAAREHAAPVPPVQVTSAVRAIHTPQTRYQLSPTVGTLLMLPLLSELRGMPQQEQAPHSAVRVCCSPLVSNHRRDSAFIAMQDAVAVSLPWLDVVAQQKPTCCWHKHQQQHRRLDGILVLSDSSQEYAAEAEVPAGWVA